MKKGDIDYEKLYKDSIERAKDLKGKWIDEDGEEVAFMIFPELKGSDKIKAEIIDFIKTYVKAHGCTLMNQWIDWIEKQGEKSITEVVTDSHFKIAEEEKTNFVSGQYVQCRKSFNEFKEDESYWFEYIGDDTYIGISDNILNKKFHITPRQLYKLFSQQHDCKQEEAKDEQNEMQEPMSYGKDIDEAMYEACRRYELPYTDADKYSLADVFHAGVRAAEKKVLEYPLCNTIKDKIDCYIANNFITDTVVKTDVKSIVKAMEEGVRLGMEERESVKLPQGFYYVDKDGNKFYSKEFRIDNGNSHIKFTVGEQKPVVWSEEDERLAKKEAFNNALDKIEYNSGEPTFDDGWCAAMDYAKKRNINTIPQQSEVPQWMISFLDSHRRNFGEAMTYVEHAKEDSKLQVIIDWMKGDYKTDQEQSKWSVYDEQKLEIAINCCEACGRYGIVQWLESLKDMK